MRTPANGQPLKIPHLEWAVVNPAGGVVALCQSWEMAVEILGNRPGASGWRIVKLPTVRGARAGSGPCAATPPR
jgi:hypothetical protein